MKRFVAISAFTLALLSAAPLTRAQSAPPPLPTMTPQQSSEVESRVERYRQQTEDRVARGEIAPDEAERLLKWREWQIAGQVTGAVPQRTSIPYDSPPPDYVQPRPRDYVVAAPPPYYAPYYAYPYPYYAPRPYYWGPAICAGGFGRHFGGRICF